MDDICKKLINPSKLWSRAEILEKNSTVPKQPGIYAWYFKEIPPLVPTDGCISYENLTLLYIGISPKAPSMNGKKSSKESIRSRLKFHMNGNAYGSTLRLSLGSLLSKRLGIQLRRVGSDNRKTFADGETLLSIWMAENAFVTWVITPEPWFAENMLIGEISLPLNLAQNKTHPFHEVLSKIRRDAKIIASELPIVTS